MYISVQKAHFTACTVTSVWTLHFSQDSFKKLISNLANTLQAFHVCPCLPSYLLLTFLHCHCGQVLMQTLAPRARPWVPASATMAAVFLQILAQSNQRGAQAGTVWCQDTSGQLEQDGGYPGHAVLCGLEGYGPNLEGGVGEPHELGEERVGATELLVAGVCGWMVMGGLGACCGAGIMMGV